MSAWNPQANKIFLDAWNCSPDGEMLAGSFSDGAIRVWDTRIGKELHSMNTVHDYDHQSMAFSPDGKTLATAGAKPDGHGEIRFWRTAMGTSK